MTDPIQVAWAAGIFEGEGCIRDYTPTGRVFMCPGLSIRMSDRDVLERFAAIVGVGTVRPSGQHRKRAEHHRDQWEWLVSGIDAVVVMEAFLPHLGERRGARARALLIQFYEERRRDCEGCGTTYLAGKHWGRFCPDCRRNHYRPAQPAVLDPIGAP